MGCILWEFFSALQQRFPESWSMNFPTDYFSSRCNGRVEAALKACFWAICSFSTYGTALKCRNTCAWHRCKTLADALEEIPSVKSSPSYTIGCNTKMSSSLCKLLFEYELTRETLNVAYSARMIFFFPELWNSHISSVKSTEAWPMLVRYTKAITTLLKVPAWEILLPFNACNWD